ncbi:MAG: Sec-independent protein translocase protein TatA [Rickettsiales bacterium]|jgi:Sec-independent protein translocase protein TatA
MFGISLAEFALIGVVAIVIIGPKNLPEVARYLIRSVAWAKHLISKAKGELDVLGKELGVEEIKNEIAIELASEKTRIEDEFTTIIDIYGKEHKVSGVEQMRGDKSKEEIDQEIAELNIQNKTKFLEESSGNSSGKSSGNSLGKSSEESSERISDNSARNISEDSSPEPSFGSEKSESEKSEK